MHAERETLTSLRRYEDSDAGIFEEFLDDRVGPGRSLVLLSAPLGAPRALGWVICPSLGPEHGNLRRLEALIARSLAVAGFPTLRIRPDLHPSRGANGEINLSTRLAEVDQAVGVLRDEQHVADVCLLGMLFGGTVAALTAGRHRASGLVLVEPATRGTQYLRETFRRQAIADLMDRTDDASACGTKTDATQPGPGPLEELSIAGKTWIRGLELTRNEYERISRIDLLAEPVSFRGSALLVGASAAGTASRGLSALRDRLESAGIDVMVELLQDPLPSPFGEDMYRSVGLVRVDARLELDQRIASATTAWATRTFADSTRAATE